MTLTDKSVTEFVDRLASKEPTPGGGSTAALAGAIGAALVSMVCNLTIGKKGYEAAEEPMSELLRRSESLRARLTALIEEDVAAFDTYSRAMKLPKETDDDRAARTAAIQEALKEATRVPLEIARAAAEAIDLCRPCAENGNKWAVSDAGVAVLLADAALRAAALNVLINLGSLKDEAFVAESRATLNEILSGTSELREETYRYVVGRL
jgi:methenyltetrahydrofolate cyclohydrolase